MMSNIHFELTDFESTYKSLRSHIIDVLEKTDKKVNVLDIYFYKGKKKVLSKEYNQINFKNSRNNCWRHSLYHFIFSMFSRMDIEERNSCDIDIITLCVFMNQSTLNIDLLNEIENGMDKYFRKKYPAKKKMLFSGDQISFLELYDESYKDFFFHDFIASNSFCNFKYYTFKNKDKKEIITEFIKTNDLNFIPNIDDETKILKCKTTDISSYIIKSGSFNDVKEKDKVSFYDIVRYDNKKSMFKIDTQESLCVSGDTKEKMNKIYGENTCDNVYGEINTNNIIFSLDYFYHGVRPSMDMFENPRKFFKMLEKNTNVFNELININIPHFINICGEYYRVAACVSFVGVLGMGGHYICDTYDWNNNQWITHDDTENQLKPNTRDSIPLHIMNFGKRVMFPSQLLYVKVDKHDNLGYQKSIMNEFTSQCITRFINTMIQYPQNIKKIAITFSQDENIKEIYDKLKKIGVFTNAIFYVKFYLLLIIPSDIWRNVIKYFNDNILTKIAHIIGYSRCIDLNKENSSNVLQKLNKSLEFLNMIMNKPNTSNPEVVIDYMNKKQLSIEVKNEDIILPDISMDTNYLSENISEEDKKFDYLW